MAENSNRIEFSGFNLYYGQTKIWYPLARNLYWYLPLKPAGDIKKLVDWVLSPEGQAIVTQVGYFTVQ